MKKNVHFLWKQHHQEALEEIKTELCKAQIISYYVIDPNTTTIFQCDVSNLGVEAWIRPINERGAEKIVGMVSRCLIPTESRYSNIEKESLAVNKNLNISYWGEKLTAETD